MEIVTKEKVTPWHEILMGMEKGEVKPFEWKSSRTIRSCISDYILNEFPDAEFTTKKQSKEDGTKYLEVKRLK